MIQGKPPIFYRDDDGAMVVMFGTGDVIVSSGSSSSSRGTPDSLIMHVSQDGPHEVGDRYPAPKKGVRTRDIPGLKACLYFGDVRSVDVVMEQLGKLRDMMTKEDKA